MANNFAGIFNRGLFAGSGDAQRQRAAQGLSQTFASIMARQMHESITGNNKGPMGIEGGASGDIYGSLMDDELGKLLANSPAMKSINAAIEREIGGGAQAGHIRDRALAPLHSHHLSSVATMLQRETAVPLAESAHKSLSPIATVSTVTADSRGPLLLPPTPTGMASELLPPSPLKGQG